MAQKKRPTKKRKKTKKTKKQKQQQEQMLTIGVGFALILFAVFGFLKLGFLGILIANGFRIIAGNTYQILCLLLAVLGFWIVIKNKSFQLAKTDAGLAVYSFISVSYYCYMPIYLANSILGNQISWERHGTY